MGNRAILNVKKETSFEQALAQVYTKAYDDAGCMIWTGSLTVSGYPRIVIDGKATSVRRMLAEKKLGRELRPDEFASSTCNCKTCIAEDHIRVVTIKQRRVETGAAGGYSSKAKGAKIAAAKRAEAKMTMELAEMVRRDSRHSEIVAAEIGVSSATVRKCRAYKSWKDYSNPFAGLGAR